ncbi:MAG: AAA family ATPase, partial [Gemmatimonadota bacterium]|nr:AAA family ATPase [Gemmatimonadota bacterium]
MHTYHRPQVDQLVFQIMQNDKPLIVAVTGPRQTGKTTMIEQALERIDLPSRYLAVDEIMAADESLRDPRGQRVWLLNAWRRARENAEAGERGFVLALDEIQHIEDWSLIVKGQWDRDRRAGCPLRVIVAGSAPWSMWTGLRDLAGRFMPVKVSHWSFTEMADAFGHTLDQ